MLASQWVWQRTKSVSIPAEEQNAGRVVDYFYRMEFHITPRFFSDSNYLFFFPNKNPPKTNHSVHVSGTLCNYHVGREVCIDRRGTLLVEPTWVEKTFQPTKIMGVSDLGGHGLDSYNQALNRVFLRAGSKKKCFYPVQREDAGPDAHLSVEELDDGALIGTPSLTFNKGPEEASPNTDDEADNELVELHSLKSTSEVHLL